MRFLVRILERRTYDCQVMSDTPDEAAAIALEKYQPLHAPVSVKAEVVKITDLDAKKKLFQHDD